MSRLFCGNQIYASIIYFLIHISGSVRKAEQTIRSTDNLVEENGTQYTVILPPIEEELTAFDIVRYCWSTAATLGSFIIIFYGISHEYYVLPTPVGATFVIFFLALTLLFYLEGLMIAVVGVQYWDR